MHSIILRLLLLTRCCCFISFEFQAMVVFLSIFDSQLDIWQRWNGRWWKTFRVFHRCFCFIFLSFFIFTEMNCNRKLATWWFALSFEWIQMPGKCKDNWQNEQTQYWNGELPYISQKEIMINRWNQLLINAYWKVNTNVDEVELNTFW